MPFSIRGKKRSIVRIHVVSVKTESEPSVHTLQTTNNLFITPFQMYPLIQAFCLKDPFPNSISHRGWQVNSWRCDVFMDAWMAHEACLFPTLFFLLSFPPSSSVVHLYLISLFFYFVPSTFKGTQSISFCV